MDIQDICTHLQTHVEYMQKSRLSFLPFVIKAVEVRFSWEDWACILYQCNASPVAAVNVMKGQKRERTDLTDLPSVFMFHSYLHVAVEKMGSCMHISLP